MGTNPMASRYTVLEEASEAVELDETSEIPDGSGWCSSNKGLGLWPDVWGWNSGCSNPTGGYKGKRRSYPQYIA